MFNLTSAATSYHSCFSYSSSTSSSNYETCIGIGATSSILCVPPTVATFTSIYANTSVGSSTLIGLGAGLGSFCCCLVLALLCRDSPAETKLNNDMENDREAEPLLIPPEASSNVYSQVGDSFLMREVITTPESLSKLKSMPSKPGTAHHLAAAYATVSVRAEERQMPEYCNLLNNSNTNGAR